MPGSVLLFCLIGFILAPVWTPAASANEFGALRPPERYILQQLTAGKVADLAQQFGPEEKNRQVQPQFLTRLLTEGFPGIKIPYQGVRINHAVIQGPLDLENIEVAPWVEFLDCRFTGPVNMRDVWFKKGLTLSRSRFDQKVEGQRLRVMLSLNLSESVFQGPVDLWRAEIGGTLLADGLRCENHPQGANFNSLTVGQIAFFRQAAFRGPVDFNGCKLADGVQFTQTEFSGPVNFFGAKVGRQLVLMQARFGGAVDFGYVAVGSQLVADGAHFLNPTQPVNFNSMKVSHSASFRQTVFSGPVNFVSATIGSEFQADGAQFTNSSQEANFNNLTVSQHAFFRGASFHGPVNFTGANIGGELAFLQTRFLFPEQPAALKEMRVGETCYVWDSPSAGGVDLSGARLLKAVLGAPAERPGTLGLLKLENAVIERLLKIENLAIGQLAARKLTVKDWAHLSAVTVTETADWRETAFSGLTFPNTTWPEKSDAVWLEGMTYRSLSAGEGEDDWRALVALVMRSRYDSRAYSQLETYFKQGGNKERADEVYIQGLRREALQKWWRPDNLVTLVFWDFLAGYGRKPGRTVWISLAIVLIGMAVFDPGNFDPTFTGTWNWLQQGGRTKTIVVRFLLSLDQFLPGIDLGLAKLWQLSQISFAELLYYHLHKLAGWILIPIGLAAVYSQFRG